MAATAGTAGIAGVKTGVNAGVTLVAASGGEAKPASFLANVFGNDLSWSPDGKSIAFSSDRSGNMDVWVMNEDGSGATALVEFLASKKFI